MEVILIRHGQSANNAGPEEHRVPDPGLTELGMRQAECTAKWLQTWGVQQLFCSPFLRSLETTRPVATATGLVPTVRAELCEQGGCYSGFETGKRQGETGFTRQELIERYPGWQIDESIGEGGWWNRGYELLPEATLRAQSVVRWLEQDLAPVAVGRQAFIIHADFKRLLLDAMLPRHAHGTFAAIVGPLNNVGVTHFARENGRWILLSLNATNHLPGNWIT